MKKVISVIGIGRVGLPLALVLANSGYKVYGIGRNKEKIEKLKRGIMLFKEKGAEKLLSESIHTSFIPTIHFTSIQKSHAVILTLGTPIDENMNPVYDQINSVLASIIPKLTKNQLIILRSTVSPGTTHFVKEKLSEKGKFIVGKDIFLAFCPERIAEGNSISEMKEIPQLIGGIDPVSALKAKEFFESFGTHCLITDATTAELAKLFTNMYRYISFAIANEFLVIAENFNRNIHEIVHLVNHGYKRNGLALPGLTAGPCLFKDGFFLINDNPFVDLIATSWKINEAMPLFLIKKIKENTQLNKKKVAILGLAFKPDIDDIRESLSFKLRKALLHEHAEIALHDPYVKKYNRQKISKRLEDVLPNADVVIIATNHTKYKEQKKHLLKLMRKGTVICDIWNIFEKGKIVFIKD